MKIGIDASRANRKFKTGTEWYGYHVIQAMKKIPVRNGDCFILYSPDKLRSNLGHLPKGWGKKQLRWPFTYVWTQIRLFWEMKKYPPDVLFVPSHTLPFFYRGRSVVTIHDICFEKYPRCYSLFARLYYPLVHRRSATIAAHIIVPSQFTKQQLVELYKVGEDKITVIPLAYDKNNFYVVEDKKKIASILVKYNINKPYFLYIGRLEKKKNIGGLISAYEQLAINNKPTLVLVGKSGLGYDKMKSRIESNNNIIHLGYVDVKDLKYLYNGAEAFIFPSLCEGFGIPVLEAMACGCPVVASKSGSIPEVGGDAVLYFDEDNIDSIVRAMKKIIRDKNLVEELRQKGLAQVNNFSWEKCAEQTMKALLRV
ncbi:glycosyltransferase family 4 protein [Patescibacteria group bacterium AH-259-L07]|nr:glycosyltransferase family 4 protein [Patescibacteria group bacterium AH-259-L07]